ncbi:MAG: UvrD-helicase domain-containing protein [Nitrososphaerales archaeon]|nr:UvrD-helicase domain-containing protein [Nitrososphaerales archaeon]
MPAFLIDSSMDTFLLIFMTILVSSLAIFLVLRLWLTRTIRLVETQLAQVEMELSGYRTFSKYLKRRDRVAQGEKLDSVQRALRSLRTYHWLLGKKEQCNVGSNQRRTDVLVAFLDHFVTEYTRIALERHKDFFEGRSFDREQIEAIVKKDSYNLVIAAAGSGKTRTLTARIAFMIKCGVAAEGILALAYTNPAEDEMRNRLKSEYGIQDANVRTFHSLGRELAKLSHSFRTGVADITRQQDFIRDSVKRLQSNREFGILLLNFALETTSHERTAKDFTTPEDYYLYLRRQKYITLQAREVKSVAERDIANFFFLNGVEFAYETPATWADRSDRYRQYQPDFYLPEYGIWMEHWAVDRQGRVPDWFPVVRSGDASTRYKEGMEWKRGQFKKHGRRLIETYGYQWQEGTLIPELKRQLEENRVEFRELPMQEILDRIQRTMPRTDPLQELMFSFISKAKTNGLAVSDVRFRLSQGSWTRKQRAFASMMIQIWQEYESVLEQNDMIDFSDMINYALQVARQKPIQDADTFTHILIDEFQDITDPQLALIKCLLRNEEDSTLFCVGDDRQNIFSFAGSNIDNILRFGEMFPYPERTTLSTNYRCPKNIVEASNSIANLNRFKIEKTVVSESQLQHPIRLIEMPGNETQSYEDWQFQRAKELLQELIHNKKPGEEIMVLARYNQVLKPLEVEFQTQDTLGLKFLSIHRAKGTEADHVLLLSCTRGRYGFPSEIQDQELLDIVRKNPGKEPDKLEEERRLFYVALTRCRNQLFLFTSKRERSRFVSEIQNYLVS